MTAMQNRTFLNWLKVLAVCFLGLLVMPVLAGCAPAAAPIVTSTAEPSAAPLSTLTEAPSPVPTLPPAATEAPTATVEPSATPTHSPTETSVPALAVLPDGFSLWCAPQEYQGVSVTGPDAPAYANLMADKGDFFQVKIPATFCVAAYRFNQPVPAGAKLVLYDGSSPFMNLPLTAAEGHPDTAWTVIAHDYVINPPLWEVTYQMAVTGPDGDELWSEPVKLAKALPAPCPFGGLPDPVTLYCRQTDPKELEPHPWVTIPPYYTIVPPEK